MILWLSNGWMIWNYGNRWNNFGVLRPLSGEKFPPCAHRSRGWGISIFSSCILPPLLKPLCGPGFQRSAVADHRDNVVVRSGFECRQPFRVRVGLGQSDFFFLGRVVS